MRLINFLPPSSRFNHSSFKQWDKARPEKRVVLSNPHSLSAEFGNRSVEGSADISYIIQAPGEPPDLGLVISSRVPLIGVQAPDLIRSLTEAYRPRTSIALSEVGHGLFDLRALAYVIGAAVAAGSSETQFPFAPHGVSVKPLSPSWTVPLSDEVTLGPGLVTDDREFQTLSSLCKLAGVADLQIMGDAIPNTTYKPFQGTRLASLSLKIFAYIISSANACGCGDHHLEAFFRGMTSVFSLWAHTDEGGWIRRALSRADYPPSSGVLASTAEECLGIPTRELIPKSETARIAVAMYLEMAGAVAQCDAWHSGIATVLTRDDQGEPGHPGSFLGLNDQTYHVMSMWRNWSSEAYGLARSLIMDTHSFRTYFDENRYDDHLKEDTIIPFWWVEPSALCISTGGSLFMPCRLGGHVVMPLARSKAVLTTDMPLTPSGTYAPGVPLRVIRGPGGLRDEGMSYLMSSRYRRKNGLNHSDYVTQPTHGVHTAAAMFVDGEVTNAAARRWVTPHNPMPSPVEGYSDLDTCVEFTYMGGAEPRKEDWLSCKVQSFLGFFRVNQGGSECAKVSHRSIPRHLLHLVDSYSRFGAWKAPRPWFETPSAEYTATPGPGTSPAEEDSPPTDSIADGTHFDAGLASDKLNSENVEEVTPPAASTNLLQDTPEIASLEPRLPPSPDTLPGDPDIRTTVSDSMGARPHVPSVQQEAKQPPKGESVPTSESS